MTTYLTCRVRVPVDLEYVERKGRDWAMLAIETQNALSDALFHKPWVGGRVEVSYPLRETEEKEG